MNLMKMIFHNVRGATRKPQKDESMQIFFNDTHDLENRILTEYDKPFYVHARPGDYFKARRVILKELKTGLTDQEHKELNGFHERRCNRHRNGGNEGGDDDESDAEGDEDEEMNEEERQKAKAARDAKDSEKAQRKITAIEDAQKEAKHVDIEALIEYVFTSS
jgi:hypothetical protein